MLKCSKCGAEDAELRYFATRTAPECLCLLCWKIEPGMAINPDSPTWRYVLKFAVRMEAKLAMYRHKGDRPGWLKDTPRDLINRLGVEKEELIKEVLKQGPAMAVWMEAADVANFAMMVADSYENGVSDGGD